MKDTWKMIVVLTLLIILFMLVFLPWDRQQEQSTPVVPCRTIGLQGMCTDTFRELINSPDVKWDIGGPSRSPYWYKTHCDLIDGVYVNCK